MDFSQDWADTVRERRLRRFARDGGPEGVYRWMVKQPRRTAWWAFVTELAALAALVLIWQPEAVSELVVELGFLVLGAALFAGMLAQILHGEKRVYEEWLGQS